MAAKPPDEVNLYEAGLHHLARYPATEASMARVLTRKLERWARGAAAEQPPSTDLQETISAAKRAIPAVVARLKAEGVLSDAAFAASRARRLRREGKSRRYALAHIAAKGVAAAIAQETLPDDPERELAAACAYLRRRRAGPFGDAPELKILAAMGRTGFTQEIARKAMRMDRDAAEDMIKRMHERASSAF